MGAPANGPVSRLGTRIWRWCRPVVLVAILLFLLRRFEQLQVYHPNRTLAATGAELGRPWESVRFGAADGVELNAWYFPATNNAPQSGRVFLLCHGNAGNISHRLDQYSLLLELGAAVFAFDYRGYGQSQGRPSEEGTYRDAHAAYQWLRAKGFAAQQIVVLGESLGGGVASELACREPIGALILQSTFTSVADLGAELFPWLPVRWLGRIKYDTANRLPQLRVPLLVLHSRADTLIPFHHAERNFRRANEPKRLVELNGDHNETLLAGRDGCQTAIKEFLAKLAPPGAADVPP